MEHHILRVHCSKWILILTAIHIFVPSGIRSTDLSEGIYLNLTLTNDLGHQGWLKVIYFDVKNKFLANIFHFFGLKKALFWFSKCFGANVVYFDQQIGSAHLIHWSEYCFSHFSHFCKFSSFLPYFEAITEQNCGKI